MEIHTQTVKLYVPKFGGVVDVRVDQEKMFREQYGATTPGENDQQVAPQLVTDQLKADAKKPAEKRPNPFTKKHADAPPTTDSK